MDLCQLEKQLKACQQFPANSPVPVLFDRLYLLDLFVLSLINPVLPEWHLVSM